MSDVAVRTAVDIRETQWLRALRGAARFVFRGDAEARLAAGAALGAPLAATPGRVVTHAGRAALALGPDEYLFIVPEPDAAAFAAEIGVGLTGRPHSLVDVSHRQVALELRGTHAEWLLAAACPLPLDIGAFPVGACTRTVFAKAEIVLWRTAHEVFRVEVARSYCRYFIDLLGEVACELPATSRQSGGIS